MISEDQERLTMKSWPEDPEKLDFPSHVQHISQNLPHLNRKNNFMKNSSWKSFLKCSEEFCTWDKKCILMRCILRKIASHCKWSWAATEINLVPTDALIVRRKLFIWDLLNGVSIKISSLISVSQHEHLGVGALWAFVSAVGFLLHPMEYQSILPTSDEC